jgi:ferrous iron transport protein A
MDSCRAWHEAPLAGSGQNEAVCSLAQLHQGARGVVSAIAEDAGAAGSAGATAVRRLIELGFVPGEPIEVIAEQRPGGDPIAVRIGSSMFALRRREAQAVLVLVQIEQPHAAAAALEPAAVPQS